MKINKQKIIDLFCIGTGIVIIAANGANLYKAIVKWNDKKEDTKQERTFDKILIGEAREEAYGFHSNPLEPVNMKYMAPVGYTLEVINGKVYAVKKSVEITNTETTDIYALPEGRIMDETLDKKCANKVYYAPVNSELTDSKTVDTYTEVKRLR